MSEAVEIEEIGTLAGLEALKPEWGALWEACPEATPFQAPEWLIPWWRRFGEKDGGSLWTLALRDGAARLVGLVPLYVWPENGERKLLLLGCGNSDYLDALFLPRHAAGCLRALLGRLAARTEAWDVCDWIQLRPQSPLMRLTEPRGGGLAPMASPAFHYEGRFWSEPCPVLPLDAVRGKQLTKWESYCRRLDQAGPVRVELADETTWEWLLRAAIDLHTRRWALRGLPGVLASEQVRDFLWESIPGLLRRGVLRLSACSVGGRLAGTLIAFSHRGRCYSYLGSFDPEFAPLSPGTVIVGHAIRQAAREGLLAFDFLRGSEPHKYRWGAKDSPTFRREFRHSPKPVMR